MAAPTAPVPLKEQFDNTQPISIALTTKPVVGAKFTSAILVSAISAAATSLQIELTDAYTWIQMARPFPAWLNASAVFRLGSAATSNEELLTVSGVAISGTIATLTCTATTYAHAAGDNCQIQESVGSAATATYTFASTTLNTANRGIILELCDLLDRALREGSASVA